MEEQISSIEPMHFFGLTTSVSSNSCLFLTDEKIVYHASGLIIIQNTVDHSQKFMYLNEPLKVITTMELNAGKYDDNTLNSTCIKILSESH